MNGPDLATLLGDSWPRRTPDQVAFVVHDLGAAVQSWNAVLAADDDAWKVFTYGPEDVHDLTYRGRPGDFSMTLAMCGTEPQVELVQAGHGDSIYSEWADQHGAGLHHLGYFVESIADCVDDLASRGLRSIQSGSGYGVEGDGGFAYYELPGIAAFIELIEVPRVRRASEPVPPRRTPEQEN